MLFVPLLSSAIQIANTASWWDLAKQVPALALLVFIVLHFLRHLERIDEKHRGDMQTLTASHERKLEDLVSEYRAVARQSIQLHERVIARLKDES